MTTFIRAAAIMAVAGLVVSGTAAVSVAQGPPPGIRRIDLQRHDLGIPGREVVQVRVELDSGVVFGRHSHPGEEIVNVLEGSLEYQIDGNPPVTLEAGGVLFIPAGAIHAAKNVGTGNGAELATYIVEKGKPLVVMAAPAAGAANDTAIRPFRVNVPAADLADLKRRLAATRWPDKETVADGPRTPSTLGQARLPEPDLFPPRRSGWPLRGLGASGRVRLRAPCRISNPAGRPVLLPAVRIMTTQSALVTRASTGLGLSGLSRDTPATRDRVVAANVAGA